MSFGQGWTGDESGPQVEDFKYLRNLLEVGKREDGLKAASSVQTVYQCAVVKRELTIKGKLLIFW